MSKHQYQDIINSLKLDNYDFDMLAKEVFSYQSVSNPTYRRFLDLIGFSGSIDKVSDIPFCPISVFKHEAIKTGSWSHREHYFLSSGTGGDRSRHEVRDILHYHNNAQRIFERQFGLLSGIQVIGLLPHYSDNPNSSLLSMVDHFISCSNYDGLYYLDDLEELSSAIEENKRKGIKTLIIGVSFAMLDYAHQYSHQLNDQFIIIETGGMKRYRREMTKGEIHDVMRSALKGALICTEYGMTECLSQAYSLNESLISMNRSFRVVITDPMDPGQVVPHGKTGRINIVDLANVATLSFIATDDIGRIDTDDPNKFEVIGRLSNTDLRGCNHLI